MTQERILLEETFYVLTKKNSVFRVRLTRTGLSLIKQSQNQVKEQTIPIRDIVGCRCLRSKKTTTSCACQSLPRGSLKVVDENSPEQDETDVSAYLYVYAYILQSTRNGNSNKREKTIITLRFRTFDKYEENYKEAQRWRSMIKDLVKGEIAPEEQEVVTTDVSIMTSLNEQRKLLVICNPKSGPGRGKSIFEEKVAPVLQEAEIQFEFHITKHANYARELIRTCNIFQWNGVVVVGGDGIVYEVINGMFERPDWASIVECLPIAVVPGGSGNGLARSVAYYSGEPYVNAPTLPSALSIVRHRSVPMDLVRVENSSQIFFSFLSVGWGLLSDIDIESERLRILGGQRFTVWSVARLIGLRSYTGKVYYLPPGAQIGDTNGNPIGSGTGSATDLSESTTTNGRPRLDSWYSAASKRSAYFSATGSSYQSTAENGEDEQTKTKNNRMYGPPSQIPCLTAPLTSPWVCLEGKFVMVHASYQSHLGEDCFFAPESRLNDGVIWLLIIRGNVSRTQMLQFLLGLSSGAHAQSLGHGIEFIPVKAFRIEPDMSERGYMTVDGEHVEYGPIQAEVCPELSRIMIP